MQSSIVHRLLWGTLIVIIGVVFLLNQLGITHLSIGDLISTYWPVFLILFGLQGLLLQHSGGGFWNGIMILAGFYFLGRNLMWFHQDLSEIVHMVWPVAIIIFGISMIIRGNGPKRQRTRERNRDRNRECWNPIVPPTPSGPPPAPPEWDEFEKPPQSRISLDKNIPEPPNDTWNEDASTKHYRQGTHGWWKEYKGNPSGRDNYSRFIGDVHFGSEYWELRPMNISHFIGDTTLDLTKSQIPVGETRVNISSFIGDVKVYVPNDIGIGIQVISSCLIGDVKVLEQKRGGLFNQMSVATPSYADSDKRVVLVVSSLIGDVRVTKVG